MRSISRVWPAMSWRGMVMKVRHCSARPGLRAARCATRARCEAREGAVCCVAVHAAPLADDQAKAAPELPRFETTGPFRIVRRLGSGGFAPVFLAEEAHGGRKLREVALKL